MNERTNQTVGPGDVAIVGLSFRLPQGINTENSFWEMLVQRRNLSTDWPEERASIDSFQKDGLYARGGHFLDEDLGVFDAPFFSITAKEAAAMDPQQRMALEIAYLAFENAGLRIQDLRGSKTAVYGATMSDDYSRIVSKDTDMAPQHGITGLQPAILPNRLSWYFDLRGPSAHVDTACSSSLVALDMACQVLRNGSATTALVIGSNMLLSPEPSLYLAHGKFLSPESKCFSFDARGSGYARGEGILALVIKPVNDAIRDGDVIRAVIRGTGVNQDGRTPTLTQPSSTAQEALIREVYANAGLGFESTRFFEAHGTGTAVGDPIEMMGIGNVFRSHRSDDTPLFVGSVKSNTGHLEGASAIVGIIKTILALEKSIIPPNALFEKINPRIDLEYLNVKVPTESLKWPVSGARRASVNSFGYGGTNCHLILDDAFHYMRARGLDGFNHCTYALHTLDTSPRRASGSHANGDANGNGLGSRHNTSKATLAIPAEPAARLLVWSAADKNALQRMAQEYKTYFRSRVAGDHAQLNKLAYTLAARRSAHPWRTYAVVGPKDTIEDDLDDAANLTSVPMAGLVRIPSEDTNIAFVFTGQGAQYVGMGLELLQYPCFANSIDKSNHLFNKLGCNWEIKEVLESDELIHRPEYSQPLCTALQLALIELLQSLGVVPSAVVGHSSGEIAAAYAIGALSHESACKVAYHRGQVTAKLQSTSETQGSMISVNLSEAEGRDYLQRHEFRIHAENVTIACVNSPTNVTLSGDSVAIDMIKNDLDAQGVFAQRLRTGVAYHSPAMCAVAAEYKLLMGELHPPVEDFPRRYVPMISSVSGRLVGPKMLSDPQYWVNNLVSPVRFVDAIQTLAADNSNVTTGLITDLVEIGPHPALRRPARDSIASKARYHSSLERGKSSLRTLLNLVGSLFCHGHPVSTIDSNMQAMGSLPYLVDCPAYPFDRSRSYWVESRLSKDYRLRPVAEGYMLGKRAHDWNALRPRWRNWLCTETMPWLRDHTVAKTVICPGTGMIVMALEAAAHAASMASEIRTISGFYIKRAHFLAPIPVGNSMLDATEATLHLRPVQSTYEKQSSKYEVSIFTYHENRWRECFRSDIQIQYESKTVTQVDGGQEDVLELARIFDLARQRSQACTDTVAKKAFYDFCGEHGIEYGECFQLLDEIAWDGVSNSTAVLNLDKPKQRWQPVNSPSHPTVLDAAIHLVLTQVSKGLSEHIPTLVPGSVSNVWISAKPWTEATSSLRLTSTLHPHQDGVNDLRSSLCVEAADGSPLCSVGTLYMSAISQPGNYDEVTVDRTLLYNIAWKPQISSLSPKSLLEVCDAASQPYDEEHENAIADIYTEACTLMRLAARRALRQFTERDLTLAPRHIRRYVAAMTHMYVDNAQSRSEGMDDEDLDAALENITKVMPAYRVFFLIGLSLLPILQGEMDALEVMFANKAAETLYHFLVAEQMRDGRFQIFLDLATHEEPRHKILEVGAGTGSTTRYVLEALQKFEAETGQSRFASYTYTDVSAAFFKNAKEHFGDVQGRLNFQKLDLEQDPEKQGFELGSYDLIVAGLVLHTTSNLTKTLTRLHKLLKPGGRIAFHEVTSIESPIATVAFGLLEGWWKSVEEHRRHTPLLTSDGWTELLLQTGFSGSDLALRDYKSDTPHFCTLIISSAVADDQVNSMTNGLTLQVERLGLILLVDEASGPTEDVIAGVGSLGNIKQVMRLSDVLDKEWQLSPSDIVVSLVDFGSSRLARLSEADFHALQKLLQNVQNLLWVSMESRDDGADLPFAAMASGLLRAIRSEEPSKHIVTLIIDSCGDGAATKAKFINTVLESCFTSSSSFEETEFFVRHGHLNVGRLLKEVNLDAERISRIEPRIRNKSWSPGPPLALEVGTPGMIDTLRFSEDLTCDDELGPDEVQIEAAAWHVNFRDVFIALGRLGSEKLGFECVGTVTRVGAACKYDFDVGDRVVMVCAGSFRSHPRASAELVVKIPDNLAFHDVVGIISSGVTAWYSLVEVARLQAGEKVLIHSGAGSTGQMAIAIAQMVGAEVYATVGYDSKKQLLVEKGVPDDHILYSRDMSFAKGIMRATNGEGVDVILNSLSGDGLRASWECLAPYGRFVEIGKADIRANSSLPMGGFAKNCSFNAVDLHHICQVNRKLMRDLPLMIINLVSQGKISGPSPRHVYPVSDIEKAFRLMQSGANSGRIIVSRGEKDIVPKFLVHRTQWHFDPEASYVVAGGFGGIGRAILRWMAKRGAKNLIVLSRSGISSSKAANQAISDLTQAGVRVVAPCCNTASLTDLTETLRHVTASMPPIKGCINCAMVLQDSIFENMTYAQWSTTVGSKVSSSWNLHKLLPHDLDFFILLSSLAGTYGSPGQANYAAGCTFQDALARSRTTSGQRGSVSLDLGWMRTIGIIAETEEYRRNQQNAGAMNKVEDVDLFALLDHYCDPSLAPIDPDHSQVLVGAVTQTHFHSKIHASNPLLSRQLFAGFDAPHLWLQGGVETNNETKNDLGKLFRQANSRHGRTSVIVAALKAKLARALGVAEEEVDPRRTLPDYGTDSLMAVELRNWLRNEFGVSLAVFEIMGGSSIAAVGNLVAEKAEG